MNARLEVAVQLNYVQLLFMSLKLKGSYELSTLIQLS
jgi:hypothetical protein